MELHFIISKLLSHFILPPGIFVVLLFLAGFVARRFKILFFAGAIFGWLVSIEVVADFFTDKEIQSSESFVYDENLTDSLDGVVVLGLGVVEDSPSFLLPPEGFKSLIYGITLAKENKLPLYYSGGGAKETKEGDVAKEFWERFRKAFEIEEGRLEILYERDSLNTEENAGYTKKIFKNKGIAHPRIALVTAGWHIKRAKMAFEAEGFSVLAKSTEVIKGGGGGKKEYTFMSYLPSVDALRINREILRDILGRFKIWVFGLERDPLS